MTSYQTDVKISMLEPYSLSPVYIQTQALAFLAVFVYATHATQAIAFEWKPGFSDRQRWRKLTGLNNCHGL